MQKGYGEEILKRTDYYFKIQMLYLLHNVIKQ